MIDKVPAGWVMNPFSLISVISLFVVARRLDRWSFISVAVCTEVPNLSNEREREREKSRETALSRKKKKKKQPSCNIRKRLSLFRPQCCWTVDSDWSDDVDSEKCSYKTGLYYCARYRFYSNDKRYIELLRTRSKQRESRQTRDLNRTYRLFFR